MFAIVAIGCATESPAPATGKKAYTQAETNLLTYCTGLTDTAWSIAVRKLAGVKQEEVKAYYAKHPNTELTFAAVDKVYGDTFTHSWDYSVSFFQECALNIAHIPNESSKLGAYCMQNSMLASLAQEYKAAGKTKAQAYELLPVKGNMPKTVVDAVYAKSKTRAVAGMDAWNDCIGPITGK
jgi:hypothetical protein